jgi:enediyne core biosynthesis thioesterase
LFLRDFAPGVIQQLSGGLSLLTVRCCCDYFTELSALDEISVRMFLEELILNRLVLRFEYWKISGTSELVARGIQEIACMRRRANGGTESVDIPDELRRALEPYHPSYLDNSKFSHAL